MFLMLKKEKLYEFYKCDYCGKRNKNTEKFEDRTGGLVTFPLSLTMKRNFEFSIT